MRIRIYFFVFSFLCAHIADLQKLNVSKYGGIFSNHSRRNQTSFDAPTGQQNRRRIPMANSEGSIKEGINATKLFLINSRYSSSLEQKVSWIDTDDLHHNNVTKLGTRMFKILVS